MKKLYLIDFESKHYTPFIANELWAYLGGAYKTRKEATKRMVELTHFFKKQFKEQIEFENYKGNTLSVDLTCFEVDDDYDFEKESDIIWEQEHYLVDSRYLCGRY